MIWEKLHKASEDFNTQFLFSEFELIYLKCKTKDWTKDIDLHSINVARYLEKCRKEGCLFSIDGEKLVIIKNDSSRR